MLTYRRLHTLTSWFKASTNLSTHAIVAKEFQRTHLHCVK